MKQLNINRKMIKIKKKYNNNNNNNVCEGSHYIFNNI